MSFRFRDFPIYKEIRDFVSDMYQLSNTLPEKEKYGLSSQLTRASTSILLNLAEGAMKKSDAEFARFMLISIGSLSEVVSILDICLDQEYISSSVHQKFLVKCEILAKKLYGFQRKLKN